MYAHGCVHGRVLASCDAPRHRHRHTDTPAERRRRLPRDRAHAAPCCAAARKRATAGAARHHPRRGPAQVSVCVCSCQSVCPSVCLCVCTWHAHALAARFFLQQDASTPASTPPSPVCTGVFACNAPARKARAHTSLLPHARAHTKMVLVERWGASRRETPGSVVLRARHTARRARGQVPSLALSAAICIFCFPPLLFLPPLTVGCEGIECHF